MTYSELPKTDCHHVLIRSILDAIRARFGVLMKHAGGGYSVYQNCDDTYLSATLLPGIGLEQAKDGLLNKIMTIP
jgi:hypothetical protein